MVTKAIWEKVKAVPVHRMSIRLKGLEHETHLYEAQSSAGIRMSKHYYKLASISEGEMSVADVPAASAEH